MDDKVFDIAAVLAQTVLQLGSREFSLGQVLGFAGLCLLVLLVLFFVLSLRNASQRAANEAAALERAREAETRMAELVASQNALTGRMQTMGELFSERLEGMSGGIRQSLSDATKNTQTSLGELQKRLAVIDNAQSNITDLAGQVVELQNILSNKQTRGAFGEARMQAIVQDGLPIGAYEFQPTMDNGTRPDCMIKMPNDSPPLVIDAKFPLESWNRIRKAKTPEETKSASQQFRRDVEIHIKDISEKYLVAGETQDMAFMFVPSESVFAEIHENFETLVKKAHRARVIIVSPSLLMLSIQVIQSVLKDVRMREQAHLIQGEVMRLMEDVARLDERVHKLNAHFTLAQKDVDLILTSSDKVAKRGSKITNLEFEDVRKAESPPKVDSKPKLKAVE